MVRHLALGILLLSDHTLNFIIAIELNLFASHFLLTQFSYLYGSISQMLAFVDTNRICSILYRRPRRAVGVCCIDYDCQRPGAKYSWAS